MGHQNLGEARNLEVGLAKGGSDIGKITEEGVFHHPARARGTYTIAIHSLKPELNSYV
jgi:hypothetical protein